MTWVCKETYRVQIEAKLRKSSRQIICIFVRRHFVLKYEVRFLYTNRIEENQSFFHSFEIILSEFYRNWINSQILCYFENKFANCAMCNMFPAIQMKEHTNHSLERWIWSVGLHERPMTVANFQWTTRTAITHTYKLEEAYTVDANDGA